MYLLYTKMYTQNDAGGRNTNEKSNGVYWTQRKRRNNFIIIRDGWLYLG